MYICKRIIVTYTLFLIFHYNNHMLVDLACLLYSLCGFLAWHEHARFLTSCSGQFAREVCQSLQTAAPTKHVFVY